MTRCIAFEVHQRLIQLTTGLAIELTQKKERAQVTLQHQAVSPDVILFTHLLKFAAFLYKLVFGSAE